MDSRETYPMQRDLSFTICKFTYQGSNQVNWLKFIVRFRQRIPTKDKLFLKRWSRFLVPRFSWDKTRTIHHHRFQKEIPLYKTSRQQQQALNSPKTSNSWLKTQFHKKEASLVLSPKALLSTLRKMTHHSPAATLPQALPSLASRVPRPAAHHLFQEARVMATSPVSPLLVRQAQASATELEQ